MSLLYIGMILATLKRPGNCPVEMLILIIFNSVGLTISADFLRSWV